MSTLHLALSVLLLATVVRAGTRRAICNVVPNSADPPADRVNVAGTVDFSQNTDGGDTTVRVSLTGLTSGDSSNNHGFHVHEGGDMSTGCGALGGHYNPTGVNHGAQNATVRHVGDLGNIVQDADGNVEATIVDDVISLQGTQSIIGRSIVVHANQDDLGLGGDAGSIASGNAGPRQGCCIITLTDDGSNGASSTLSQPFTALLTSLVVVLTKLLL